MNLSTVAVKKTARTALKGNYCNSIAVSSLYVFVFIVCTVCYEMLFSVLGAFVSFLFLLVVFAVFIIPVTLGVIYFTVRLIFGQNIEPILIFKYFSSKKDFKRALNFSLLLMGNALFFGILLFLPSFFADLIADGRLFKMLGAQIPLWTSGLSGLSAFLKVLASVLLFVLLLKFYLAPFLLVADENTDPAEALYTSKVISKATKKDFIWLILSLFWYILSCIFVIPDIFVFPYFSVSYCVHCRFCIASYNSFADRENGKAIPSFEVTL